jgi:hypothetical protein
LSTKYFFQNLACLLIVLHQISSDDHLICYSTILSPHTDDTRTRFKPALFSNIESEIDIESEIEELVIRETDDESNNILMISNRLFP